MAHVPEREIAERRVRMKRVLYHLAIAVSVGLSLVRPTVSAADNNYTQQISTIVRHICSDGGNWLRCYSLSPSECQALMTEVVTPCTNAAFTAAKIATSQEQRALLAGKLLECFNHSFMSKYGQGKVDTAECKDPPSHLQ
jgi:hypothetical protein